MTANEGDLGVDVVRGCFSEGGDSILSASLVCRSVATKVKHLC